MCVILYKPSGIDMPDTSILKKCFKENPHGAGYMLTYNNKVVIRKGFMDYKSFENDLFSFIHTYDVDPVATPIVMHFRISTQGGVQKGLCHPYPVCRTYDNMRKLSGTCDFGIAHNGIISLTSEYDWSSSSGYGYWDRTAKKWVSMKRKPLDYNDTMTFIKDYLSLIIDKDMYFARNRNKCELIERLGGNSKFAIMNSKGFVKLIGDFTKVDGLYFSNLYWQNTPKHVKSYLHIVGGESDGACEDSDKHTHSCLGDVPAEDSDLYGGGW